jgi:hypothetical protein
VSVNKLAVLLFAGLLLAGCAPVVQGGPPTGQPVRSDLMLLASSSPVGQTFVAAYDGLAGVQVYLEPGPSGESQAASSGSVWLHLRADPSSSEDLGVAVMPVSEVSAGRMVRFDFDPLQASRRQYYYAFLQIEGEGSLLVGVAPGDTYLEGAIYQGHQPLDGQTNFALAYDSGLLLRGLVRQMAGWAGLLLAGFLLYVLPGWGLAGALWSGWDERSWPEKLGLAAGVSLAIYPLLMVFTDLVGLHLGAAYAWLPPLAGLAAIEWRSRRGGSRQDIRQRLAGLRVRRSELRRYGFNLLFLLVIGLVFAVRLWAIRLLEAPLWGDSVQHTMITQLLVENGGLFDSWEPYAALESLTYHFGFHAAAAALSWVSGLSAARAVLWTGQLLNGLAVLALVPLAVRLGGAVPLTPAFSQKEGGMAAGLGAVLVAGLLLPMPMYYTNWGRYTQLAGLVILPVAVYLIWDLLDAPSPATRVRPLAEAAPSTGGLQTAPANKRPALLGGMALGWVLLAGLALAHYRILFYAPLFIPALLLLRLRRLSFRVLLIRLTWLGGGALALFAPWLWRVIGGRLLQIFGQLASTPAGSLSSTVQQTNAIGDIFFFLPAWAWVGLLLAMGWGLWQRRRAVAVVSLWWLLLLLATNPGWFRLPGTGILSNFALFISAYLLAGMLGGALAGWGAQAAGRLENKVWRVGLGAAGVILALALAVSGARQRLGDINLAAHALVTRPDVRAAAWMRDHTPQNARFLVNSFFAYNDTLVVGSDGGWWLPLLAGRKTSLPPITYGFEAGQAAGQSLEATNLLAQEIQAKGVTHPDVLALLAERGISYVYIGQRQGRVNYSGPSVLDPRLLIADAHFKVVYHQDRVWIFEIVPADTNYP